MSSKKLTPTEKESILTILKTRFTNNAELYKNLNWEKIQARLEQNLSALWSLSQMEKTGGEPCVLYYSEADDTYTFCDFSKESPKERRSLCYDRAALESRKKHKPKSSALDMAADMGITLMTETDYKKLQSLGTFDTKTSSWLHTPQEIRKLGGAIFADCRYNQVFIYHNGAESYYAARGFRGIINI
jgi:hypothetical protein